MGSLGSKLSGTIYRNTSTYSAPGGGLPKPTQTVSSKMTARPTEEIPSGPIISGVLARDSGATGDNAIRSSGFISGEDYFGDLASEYGFELPFSNLSSQSNYLGTPIIGDTVVTTSPSKMPWILVGLGALVLFYMLRKK